VRKCKGMSSPDGQVSGMPGRARVRGSRGWLRGVASRRPPQGLSHRGRRASLASWSGAGPGFAGHLYVVDLAGRLPSVRGVIGLRQVDGMPHGPPLARSSQHMPRSRQNLSRRVTTWSPLVTPDRPGTTQSPTPAF
jgi:hypothetical protein